MQVDQYAIGVSDERGRGRLSCAAYFYTPTCVIADLLSSLLFLLRLVVRLHV